MQFLNKVRLAFDFAAYLVKDCEQLQLLLERAEVVLPPRVVVDLINFLDCLVLERDQVFVARSAALDFVFDDL